MLNRFPDPACLPTPPVTFPSPFENCPHPLAAVAAEELMMQLRGKQPIVPLLQSEGRMFAVLVVRDSAGGLGWLGGVSGTLTAELRECGLVPGIADETRLATLEQEAVIALGEIDRQIAALEAGSAHQALLEQRQALQIEQSAVLTQLTVRREIQRRERKTQRLQASQAGDMLALRALDLASRRERETIRQARQSAAEALAALDKQLADIQAQINTLKTQRRRRVAQWRRQRFDAYRLRDFSGTAVSLREAYQPGLPPDGSGDCAEPRLLHYAARQGLSPVAMASFWWGASPKAEVRHAGRFYPACRGRCGPLLPTLLQGLPFDPPPRMALQFDATEPTVLYEDDQLIVVNKPSGMLSVPGKRVTDSVVTRLQGRGAKDGKVMAVHRLDMSTSGVMLLAKTHKAFVHLQRQFTNRQVSKHYEAILDGTLSASEGEIRLPLRTDFHDRPRQVVCETHGKPALTRWQALVVEDGRTRVAFYPHTGRTHQLRMHAAHTRGLGVPILGDELYGAAAGRLHLHALQLEVRHPVDGRLLAFFAPTPF